jgi:uncharacterized protein YlxW (UPF0749 family)
MSEQTGTEITERIMRCSKQAIVQFLLCHLLVSEKNARRIEEIDLELQLHAIEKKRDEKMAEVHRLRERIKTWKDDMKYRLAFEEVDRLDKRWDKLIRLRWPDWMKTTEDQASQPEGKTKDTATEEKA